MIPATETPPRTGEPGPSGHPLDRDSFRRIAQIAHGEAGLAIAEGKAAMVKTRLARRLRGLKLDSYRDYCDFVESPAGAGERREMISALTTNVSHFFREAHHFERLKTEVLPPLLQNLRQGGSVRIWSAGCSNGQEPYSVAMTLAQADGFSPAGDLRILATDIDPVVVDRARRGLYDGRLMDGLPAGFRDRYFERFEPLDAKGEDRWQIAPELRAMIRFNELNLLHDWPMKRRFDVIFCRNVVIYFDADTQNRLWPRFFDRLKPGGWLFLGHSERVSETCAHLFANAGVTAYRRGPDPVPVPAPAVAAAPEERTRHGAS